MKARLAHLRSLWAHGGWSMGLFALAAGGIAAWSMQHYLGSRIADIEASHRTPTVLRLVAAFDITAGDPVSDSTLAVAEVPQPWAASDGLEPDHFGQWEGAVFVRGLNAGEQVLATHMRASAPPTLAATLAPGRRAVTIVVDDMSAQAGLLQPGDRLDVYVTLEQHGARRTHLLLTGMRVLAIGSRAMPREETRQEDVSTLTLDASLREATRLIAARQTGTLGAVLQNDPAASISDRLPTLSADVQLALGLMTPAKAQVPKQIPVLYGNDQHSAGLPPPSQLPFGAGEALPW